LAEPIQVLIVDDHPVVRHGLRAFLDLQDGIVVAGEAGDGGEAERMYWVGWTWCCLTS
jgi:DNA-binding NarL/FixJ family response regulator